jgi:hypothetical protein
MAGSLRWRPYLTAQLRISRLPMSLGSDMHNTNISAVVTHRRTTHERQIYESTIANDNIGGCTLCSSAVHVAGRT